MGRISIKEIIFEFVTISKKHVVSFRRKDNNKNGMVVVETAIPSGFKGDADKSGGNAPGLRYVEADFDRVNVYFDSVWARTLWNVSFRRKQKNLYSLFI